MCVYIYNNIYIDRYYPYIYIYYIYTYRYTYIYISGHGVYLNLFSEQRVLGKRPGKRPGPDGFHQFCQYPQAICRLDIYIDGGIKFFI
jgi:hypothetical protein